GGGDHDAPPPENLMVDLIVEEQWSEPASAPAAEAPTLAAVEATPGHRPLPEQPLLRIGPARGWVPLNLRELWAHRELYYILVLRDVTVRYKQTFLGIAWKVCL